LWLSVLTVYPSYLMIVKSLLPRVIAAIHHRVASPNTRLPDWALSSHVWLCFIMSILAPLSFMRHLNSFRYVSYIAILATGKGISSLPRGDHADGYSNKHTLSFSWSMVTSTRSKALRNRERFGSFILPRDFCRLSRFRCSLLPVPRM